VVFLIFTINLHTYIYIISMKDKKIKKIVEMVVEQLNHLSNEPMKARAMNESEDFFKNACEYNQEVSDKIKKLVLNLINYKENLIINLYDDSISIGTNNIKNYKKINTNNSGTYNDDNHLEINIRENGFVINLGYKKSSKYKDDKLFNELLPIIKQRQIEIHQENFEEIYTDILIESGIMRDNNLEELGI